MKGKSEGFSNRIGQWLSVLSIPTMDNAKRVPIL